jgi:Family of unknown function (DUF6318)
LVRRWTVGLAACALALPLLAGCSTKHEASQSLPTTSRATSSQALPPLGPSDFPVPAEARVKSASGAEAFTRYYIELLNHQLATLDSGPIRNLSRNCETCSAMAESYDHARAAGQKYEGGRLSVSSTGTAVVDGDNGEVSFLLQQEAVTVHDSQGAVLPGRSAQGVTLGGGLRLGWEEARSTWIVTQLDANKV